MKACVLGLLFLSWTLVAQAQGTVSFANVAPAGQGVNAPVYESDGVTPLSGSQFMAELLAGPSANTLASIATTGFLTGSQGGYFNGGYQTIPGVVNSPAWIQVDVWNTASGSTFDQAKASGLPNSWWQSSVFSVMVGGGFQGPPPAPLTGLGTSPVYLNSVPEPSALALLSCGLVAGLLRKVLNKPRHRMSGTNINLKTESRRMPLIGAFCR